jgi:hypothetical protein
MIGFGKRGTALTIAAAFVFTACGNSKRSDESGGEAGDGGRGGTAARGGSGGSSTLAGVYPLDQRQVDKVDLLFMIDNSISMADKQRILADAVPVLVQRLVDPICVDGEGNPVGGTNMGGCGMNSPEFPPPRGHPHRHHHVEPR